MSDDHGGPAGGSRGEDAEGDPTAPVPRPGPRSEPDRTQAFDPRSEPDRTQAFDPRSEPGRTPAFDPWSESDRTQAFDPGSESDRTRAFGVPDDPTMAGPPGSAGRPPGAPGSPDATRQQPPGPVVWSGRAGVPPPRPAAGAAEPAEWTEYDPRGGRPWWLPILIGVLALLLIGVLGFVVWLATEGDDRNAPVAPSPSASSARPSATPTTAAPTSPTTPTAGPTSAAPVPMPPLVGLPVDSARELLDDLGLDSRVERRASGQPEGTVLDTEPGAGALVTPGETVTLIVAQPRPTQPPPTTPTEPQPTTTPSPSE